MFMMRFDMRVPGKTSAQIADMYETAIEMAQWADDKGCVGIGLSEHHAADDGYLPSPLMLASAIAAVTKKTPIIIGCALLPMYDPVRLAEDMIVLDHISRGRVTFIFGIGYRPAEYELYGLDYEKRGAIADEKLSKLLAILRQASEGHDMPRVTPASFRDGRPTIAWGGATKVAARRAGRMGVNLFAQTDAPELREEYIAASRKAGFEPGICILPSPAAPNVVFVNPDVDAGWREVGPYLLHDAVTYANWNEGSGRNTVSLSHGTTIDELREENGARRVVDVQGALQIIKQWGRLPLGPLCGGCPPDLAWTYLRRIVDDVLSALGKAGPQ